MAEWMKILIIAGIVICLVTVICSICFKWFCKMGSVDGKADETKKLPQRLEDFNFTSPPVDPRTIRSGDALHQLSKYRLDQSQGLKQHELIMHQQIQLSNQLHEQQINHNQLQQLKILQKQRAMINSMLAANRHEQAD